MFQKVKFYGIQSIAKLKNSFKLNSGKVICKSKDLNRVRPLISYFENIAKSAGRFSSIALNVVIIALAKIWNTFDLYKTSDFLAVIKRLNLNGKWFPLIKDGNITYFEFEVKEMYSNLDKPEVTEALKAAFTDLHSKLHILNVSIHKKRAMKSKDKLGLPKSKKFKRLQNPFLSKDF